MASRRRAGVAAGSARGSRRSAWRASFAAAGFALYVVALSRCRGLADSALLVGVTTLVAGARLPAQRPPPQRPPVRHGGGWAAAWRPLERRKGGAARQVESDDHSEDAASTAPERSLLVQAWGAVGVAAYLLCGISRVVPIVLDGIGAIDSPLQWGLLAATLVFFSYYEGYKGFQKGFSPRVVSRAWVVSQRGRGPSVSAKALFKRYGSAYLLTSISLAICSFSACLALVRAGVDMPALLGKLGIATGTRAAGAGTAALAYAMHKALSPVRFPPTVALTAVVARWMGKAVDKGEDVHTALPVWHKILAPAFCIGYFHGSRKRVISSWCVTSVIFAVVVGVKRLPNPYRAIIDAGVLVGLTWGAVSICVLFAQSIAKGKQPDYDPSLPSSTPYKA